MADTSCWVFPACPLPRQAHVTHPELKLTMDIAWATFITTPIGSVQLDDPRGPLKNKRLAMQSCSELVSALKAGSQPAGAEAVGYDVFEMRVVLASSVTMAGPSLHAWARSAGLGGWLVSTTSGMTKHESADQQLGICVSCQRVCGHETWHLGQM